MTTVREYVRHSAAQINGQQRTVSDGDELDELLLVASKDVRRVHAGGRA